MSISLASLERATVATADILLALRNRLVLAANRIPADNALGFRDLQEVYRLSSSIHSAMTSGVLAIEQATACVEQLADTLARKGSPPAT